MWYWPSHFSSLDPKFFIYKIKGQNSISLSSLSARRTLFLCDLSVWPYRNHLKSSSLTLFIFPPEYTPSQLIADPPWEPILDSYSSIPTFNLPANPVGANFNMYSESNHFLPLLHPGLQNLVCILFLEHISICTSHASSVQQPQVISCYYIMQQKSRVKVYSSA